jgi:hypothetical protein
MSWLDTDVFLLTDRMNDLGNCAGCNRPLIEIDHCGERLIGCVRCNRWGWQPDKPLFMELPEEDIRAIREAARRE